jgi:hypothetical protein
VSRFSSAGFIILDNLAKVQASDAVPGVAAPSDPGLPRHLLRNLHKVQIEQKKTLLVLTN